jgi:lysophospholipase L1-like esterase
VPIYVGHTDNVDMLQAGVREMGALSYYWMRGWIDPSLATGTTAASTSHSKNATMKNHGQQHNSGPVVILGASYAGGWNLKSLAGMPVVNSGMNGQESTQMLERFERDVVATQPSAVIIWGFINDIFRAPPEEDRNAALDRIRENYTRMVALARTHGIEPIVATEVTMGSRDSWTETAMSWAGALLGKESYQDRINAQVMAANGWLLEMAKREGLMVLDFQRVLAGQSGRRRPEFTHDDGSHISAVGYDALTAFTRAVFPEHLVGF